jgi:hypothetical protein
MNRSRLTIMPMMLASWAISTAGCSWINPRSGFERDPFVMSHLSRSDDFAFDGRAGDPSIARLSRSNRTALPSASPPRLSTHASDFSWVMGRIAPSTQEDGAWALQFDDSKGERREIPLEHHPLLGQVRPGDKVMVEGNLVATSRSPRTMRVRRVALIP